MNKRISGLIIVLLLLLRIYILHSAQSDSINILKEGTGNNFNVFLGINYGSNYLYYGRTITENKPYYSADIMLLHKSGFWAAAAAYHLFNEVPYVNFYDLSLGWQNNFNTWLDGGITFTRFNFPKAGTDGTNLGFTFWTVQAGFDWQFLYTSINSSVLTGDEVNFYLIMKNSRYFQTKKFANNKMYFSFDPSFTFVAGTQEYYKVTVLRRPIGRWPGRIIVEESRNFELLDFQLTFPATFNWGNISIEPAITYYRPISISYNDFAKEGFYFYFSLFFNI